MQTVEGLREKEESLMFVSHFAEHLRAHVILKHPHASFTPDLPRQEASGLKPSASSPLLGIPLRREMCFLVLLGSGFLFCLFFSASYVSGAAYRFLTPSG